MEKCCKTCRNYHDGRCYSDSFVKRENLILPEVYIQIDKEGVIKDLEDEGNDFDSDVIEEIVDMCKYHSDYEFENDVHEIDLSTRINEPSEFYCKDYR